MSLSLEFSTDFQTRTLAVAATQPFFLGLYRDIFKPSMFTSEYHRNFCSWVGEFYAKYGVPPSKTSLCKILREKIPKSAPLYKGYRILLDQIYGLEVDDAEYIKDQIVRAAQFQARKGALLRMTEQLDAGDFEAMDATFDAVKRVGLGAGDIGKALTKSVSESILKYGVLEEPVRTGYKELERSSGGFYEGELTVICAPPNQGKTLLLGNLAYGAALQGHVVMYYTFEIGVFRMLNRFYAKMARLPTKELHEKIDRVRRAVRLFRLRSGGEIWVKFFPANTVTVETLRSHMAMVNGNDIHPTLAIFDYGDKIRPSNPKDPHPTRVQQVYTDLRTMGGEFKHHSMTASQSTRSTLYARLIDLDDIAESWGKAQEADTIGAVCQTREEKQAGVARLFLAKTRNETSGKFVHLRWRPEHLSVVETTREKYTQIMTRAGYAPPVDQPKGLNRLKDPDERDEELEERYDDSDDKHIDKKLKEKRK